ncbi:MAG TPA: hypothetical protein VN154_11655 [Rhizomicrobium sp.]|nr:hypothetical protein [Rhizomicrobium sp.]
MNKLPIAATIAEAYRFAFGHLGTIIGLIWLPKVLATLLNFLPEVGGAAGDATGQAAGAGAFESVAILVLTQLLDAVMYVALTRQALGQRQGPAVIHFALGPQEFRMFGAMLLFVLIGFGCALSFGLLLVAVQGVTAIGGGSAPGDLLGAMLVMAGCVLLACTVIRFRFLLAPVTVIENRVDLVRGWTLTQGNVWRILLVLLATVGPIWAIEIGSGFALMGKEIIAALPPAGANEQIVQQHVLLLEDVLRRHMPQILFITLILAPFNLGLLVSASAFGYRALVPRALAEART